ncbi:hypothetical protein M9Y10_038672 [Tritrichomonas musculus]|uniref:Uncharacterized protein n=1 Tax=Tritrichomonas musculus TaxID=1915356 RepID=A0ABR2K934_9EUKA
MKVIVNLLLFTESSNIFIFFIIGKSNVDSNEFDTLVFVNRKIKGVTIPQFLKMSGHCALNKSLNNSRLTPPQVERICENTFLHCIHLRQIDFTTQKSDQFSFSSTSIK